MNDPQQSFGAAYDWRVVNRFNINSIRAAKAPTARQIALIDEAIRRRFNLIPFTVTIPPDERDEALPEKLKIELPGIMQWMINGCVDWGERTLAPPEVVAAQ